MALVCFDLGTSSCKASVFKNGEGLLIPNSFGEYLTPSVVCVDSAGTALVGKPAAEYISSCPEAAALCFKRSLGFSLKYYLGGKTCSAEELTSFLISSLKRDAEQFLGEKVEEAVLSVPAYFSDRQRASLRQAAKLAGVQVRRFVNDPSAIALTASKTLGQHNQSYLVVDFGGGSLDVSLVDCYGKVIEIIAVTANHQIGGYDIDRAIANYFCRVNSIPYHSLDQVSQTLLIAQAECCKQVLSSANTAIMILEHGGRTHSLFLTETVLQKILLPTLEKATQTIQKVLSDANRTMETVDHLVLTGGICKTPTVRDYLVQSLERTPLELGEEDTVAVAGGAIYADILARGKKEELQLTDICPFTLSVSIHNEMDPANPAVCPIIERNSTLPASKSERFYTLYDNQTVIETSIFQGESLYGAENIKLGDLKIKVPPAPKGREFVDIRFTYDINGLLEVQLFNETTGQTQQVVIMGDGVNLGKDEVKQCLKDLSALKIHPSHQEENRILIERAERLYTQSSGSVRKIISYHLAYFEEAIASQESYSIQREREHFANFLWEVEHASRPVERDSDNDKNIL